MSVLNQPETHTISVMAGTQIIKTEFLINVAAYYICQDPSPILFVQPTQGAAAAFSKERFTPTIEVTPQLRNVIEPPKWRDSENTITHKAYAGGSIDFVGANSPTDLSSRPKRIILCDEIDKYPPSAGDEGDPLKLAEERASTYKTVGRSKFVRTCSPTLRGYSRIGREYEASDQRRLFLRCPHCQRHQVITWAHVRWDRDAVGGHYPDTAAIACEDCGTLWTERERIAALDELEDAPGYGWRQTKKFMCCDIEQVPEKWDEEGRSLCKTCKKPSPYAGHAGFHVSKLYSKRHRLPEIVQEWLDAQGDNELLRKFMNTALAELWELRQGEEYDTRRLISRAEVYGPDDLPDEVKIITGFCDVQGDRLEVQLIGWGADEECWPFLYEIIALDPAEKRAWIELDALLGEEFKSRNGSIQRISAFGIDTGGHHGAQVMSFCNERRGRRVYACKGVGGQKPIWPGRPTKAKNGAPLYLIGVDTAKDSIYSRLKIDPPEPGYRKPGYIHFCTGRNFSPEYYEQLTAERRETRKRAGVPYVVWVPVRDRNEALDTFVGALAMRKSLPRRIEASLTYKTTKQPEHIDVPVPDLETSVITQQALAVTQGKGKSFTRPDGRTNQSWMNRRGGGWMSRRD